MGLLSCQKDRGVFWSLAATVSSKSCVVQPRSPGTLWSSTGQWEWVDPGSANPFWCYACKAAMMYSCSPFQPLNFYECKTWRREALSWQRSQLLYHYNHKIIHGLVQAAQPSLMRRTPKVQSTDLTLLNDFSCSVFCLLCPHLCSIISCENLLLCENKLNSDPHSQTLQFYCWNQVSVLA